MKHQWARVKALWLGCALLGLGMQTRAAFRDGLSADSRICYWGDSWTHNTNPDFGGEAWSAKDSLCYTQHSHWSWRLSGLLGCRDYAVIARGGASLTGGGTQIGDMWSPPLFGLTGRGVKEHHADLVFILAGINDRSVRWDADTTIFCLNWMIDSCLAMGSKVVVQTLHGCDSYAGGVPEGGGHTVGSGIANWSVQRDSVNAWLRGEIASRHTGLLQHDPDRFRVFDAAALLDTTLGHFHGTSIDSVGMKPRYDSGDHLHCSMEGHRDRALGLWHAVFGDLRFPNAPRALEVDWEDPAADNWLNAGLEPGRPFKTLQGALDRALPGDTIHLRSQDEFSSWLAWTGRRHGSWLKLSRPAGGLDDLLGREPITIVGHDGARLVPPAGESNTWLDYQYSSNVAPGDTLRMRFMDLDFTVPGRTWYGLFNQATPTEFEFVNCQFPDGAASRFFRRNDTTAGFKLGIAACTLTGPIYSDAALPNSGRVDIRLRACSLPGASGVYQFDLQREATFELDSCQLGALQVARLHPVPTARENLRLERSQGSLGPYTLSLGNGSTGRLTAQVRDCTFDFSGPSTQTARIYLAGDTLELTGNRFLAAGSHPQLFRISGGGRIYIWNNQFLMSGTMGWPGLMTLATNVRNLSFCNNVVDARPSNPTALLYVLESGLTLPQAGEWQCNAWWLSQGRFGRWNEVYRTFAEHRSAGDPRARFRPGDAAPDDSSRWGGWNAGYLRDPARHWNSVGLVQETRRPGVPGDFPSLGQAHAALGALDWNWQAGDTLDVLVTSQELVDSVLAYRVAPNLFAWSPSYQPGGFRPNPRRVSVLTAEVTMHWGNPAVAVEWPEVREDVLGVPLPQQAQYKVFKAQSLTGPDAQFLLWAIQTENSLVLPATGNDFFRVSTFFPDEIQVDRH
jgi:hypothetical protein